MTQWITTLIAVVLVGLAIKGIAGFINYKNYYGETVSISWIEFAISLVVCAAIVIPVTNVVGTKLARGNLLHYNEFWGGYETAATVNTTQCDRDGSCEHTYDCDPYEVAQQVMNADGKGTHTEYHTEYHSCPEATRESKYVVETTIGNYTIADGVFDTNPVAWRGGHGIPGDVPRGTPAFWQAAKNRLDSQNPGPVTAVKQYDNYILASSSTILKKYSDEVKEFKRQKLLPSPVANVKAPIHDFYYADKMSFMMKAKPSAQVQSDWQNALSKLNASVGNDLQGDIHVVAVDGSVDPAKYTGALNAYWQDKTFGKNALSKNGIGVVLGVDNGIIAWARAFTGMPVGNAAMVQDVTNLKGLAFDPQTILGSPTGQVHGDKVTTAHSNGALENILYGPHKFQRICMKCKNEGGNGYTYLGGEIQPTSGQRWAIFTVALFLCVIVWSIGLLTFIGEDDNN